MNLMLITVVVVSCSRIFPLMITIIIIINIIIITIITIPNRFSSNLKEVFTNPT